MPEQTKASDDAIPPEPKLNHKRYALLSKINPNPNAEEEEEESPVCVEFGSVAESPNPHTSQPNCLVQTAGASGNLEHVDGQPSASSPGALARLTFRGQPAQLHVIASPPLLVSSPQPHSPLGLIHNRSFPAASTVAGLGASHFVDGEGVAGLSSILTSDKSQHLVEGGAGLALRSGLYPSMEALAASLSGCGLGLGAPSYTDAVRMEAAAHHRAGTTPISGQSFCTSAVDSLWADECQIPQTFGTYLGTALDLVPAYSNGAVEDISHGVSMLPGTDIYCGMPWECLEYARRFLAAWYGITFASMDGANSLFNCDQFMYLENFGKEGDGRKREEWTAPPVVVKREVNGEATSLPGIGSLLLYPIVYPAADMPFGHVSVVVERSKKHNRIRLAEQNWDNTKWVHKRYSRELEVSVDPYTGKVTVLDEEPYVVLGWLDFSENERRAPADWDKSYANDETRTGTAIEQVCSLVEADEGVNTSTHQET